MALDRTKPSVAISQTTGENVVAVTGVATAANQATEITALTAIQTAVEILDNTVAGSEMQVDIVTSALPTGAATDANIDSKVGSLTEGAPASDTASSGLNGRLQRVAQRLTSLIALLPTALTGNNALRVEQVVAGPTQPVSGTVTANLAAGTNNIGDIDVLSIAAGDNNIGNVDVVTLPALAAGTNNIGDVDVLTVPADPFGANADAASATGSVSAKLRFIASTGIPVTSLPNVTLAAGTNTNEIVGDAAHDAVVAGNPVLVGAEARATDGTAVGSGDAVRALATLLGKIVDYPYALPGSTWIYAAAAGGLVSTTGVTAKAAAGAGIRNYITRVQVINSHQTTSTEVVIRDGASGTVLHRGWAQAAGGGFTAVFDPPLRGTANTLVEIAEITTTATAGVLVNLQGFTAAE